MTLFVHAINVHGGGGAELLRALLASEEARGCVVQVDDRFDLSAFDGATFTIRKVKASVKDRFLAERWLAQHSKEGDVVLCFGNLPPLFRCKARVSVFVQNRYLISNASLRGLPVAARVRLMVERLWLKTRVSFAGRYIVQTPSMKRQFLQWMNSFTPAAGTEDLVAVMPFLGPRSIALPDPQTVKSDDDFVYLASGEAHKNHHRLFQAWAHLAECGIFPKLHVTLDRSKFPALCIEAEELCLQHGLKIINHGWMAPDAAARLCDSCSALIYPSFFESFGLPLLEASQRGVAVIAGELDYVRDVVEPAETFDPGSPISIARAVRRFLNLPETPTVLSTADEFLRHVKQGEL